MKKKIFNFLNSARGRELIRYCIIGVLTTAINFALTYLCEGIILVDIANAVGVVGSVLFAYVANKLFVFKRRVKGMRALAVEAGSFFASRALTMLMEIVGVSLLIWVMDLWFAKVILNVLVIIVNYILSKWLVFRKRGEESA